MSSQCIVPNPDIAGIGVRASIYVQNFITFIPAAFFALDGEVSDKEFNTIRSLSIGILLTACALLLSAFIQGATFGLNVYHANIVLNLSWINNTNFVLYVLFFLLHEARCVKHVAATGKPLDLFRFRVERKRTMEHRQVFDKHFTISFKFRQTAMVFDDRKFTIVAIASAHFCIMAALGLWVWSRVNVFGDQPLCTPEIITVVSGHSILVDNPHLRLASIVLYSITAIPVANTFIAAIFFALLLKFIYVIIWFIFANFVRGRPDITNNHLVQVTCFIGLLITAIVNILFVVDTELMIRWNASNVQPGESQWTFGQTLALLVIVVPLIDLYKRMREKSQPATKTSSLSKENNVSINVDFEKSTTSPDFWMDVACC